MNVFGLFGVLAGSSVAMALFLSSFFLFIKRNENTNHLWVGLVLLAISLRIGKSIFFFLLNDMAPIGLAIGFLGLASIGPLIWLLVRNVAIVRWIETLHFVVPVCGAVSCYIIAPSQYESLFYEIATLVLFIYLCVSWWRLLIERGETSFKWNRAILIMVSGVWLALVYQHLADTMMDYAIGALIASGFIYWLFLQSFRMAALSRSIEAHIPDNVVEEVKNAFEIHEIFRESGMNLQTFSSRTDIPPYLVTRSVKKLYRKSFPETLSYFRVEEIKQMLLDPSKEHLKIESLAYEVGFSSPSAFYASFKKHTGGTPTTYQKQAFMSA